jgi:outer membrane protein
MRAFLVLGLVIASLPSVGVGLYFFCSPAAADTIEWALVQAYQNNPSLNAQRATLRAMDETVPQALSGYRPKISVTAGGGYNYENYTGFLLVPGQNVPGANNQTQLAQTFFSRSIGATATQTLFNGFQTANSTRQAESNVLAARETLRVMEQQVLLNAASAYMNLLLAQATLDLNRSYVEALTQLLKETRDRRKIGQLTRTDLAQTGERLAAGRFSLLAAQSNYAIARAVYRQVIGVDPGRLSPGAPVDRLLPNTLAVAIKQGEGRNPSVLAAAYGVDAAELAVKVSEGALYPNLALTASMLQGWTPAFETTKDFTTSVGGALTVPVYQGGAEYSLIRQSKETVGLQRLNLDVNRDQARVTVVQTWAQRDAAKAEIDAAISQIDNAEIALDGVREEAHIGARTALDVLNAELDLFNARVSLVTAQHDRVVFSYTLLAAVGDLSMQRLGLNVPIYDPQVHYQQIRDAWFGVRLPDGR